MIHFILNDLPEPKMKQFLLLIFLIFTITNGTPLQPGIITPTGNFGTILMENGVADLTANDNGASLLIESGNFWLSGTDDKVQLFVREGVITLSGTARLESSPIGTEIQVISGFARILETGGVTGENLNAGYSRKLTSSGIRSPRRLITVDYLSQLCDTIPALSFGCPEPVETVTVVPAPTPDTVLTKAEIIVQPINLVGTDFDYSKLPDSIVSEIILREPEASAKAVAKIDYRQNREYALDRTKTYIIVDCGFPKLKPNQHEPFMEVSFYDSRNGSIVTKTVPAGKKIPVQLFAQKVTDLLIKFLQEEAGL